ncbi:hypothetical protein CERZMDRAFT_35478 [Cercospora zeae-maydis SCOH1-5]|uniref:Phosphoesterase HXTX domain-containing protein n=1 Tax=Cercospora zeae-maydis SCOH1-5 TaxID=717836 RepID=A0A6A6FPM4_9PEZI|nr:hypothetical protein CERZMDRAFT_35478 [Cercospora zeae-maydis SCOH1-5]
MSYSATLSQGLPVPAATPQNRSTSSASSQAQSQRATNTKTNINHSHPKSQSTNHPPPTSSKAKQEEKEKEEPEPVYVLTLLTTKPLHTRMTALRTHYFPRKINKLAAHLTLFHALPQSQLHEKIIPTLMQITQTTPPFRIEVTEPFRLKKGFAISVSRENGGEQARAIHQRLQEAWKEEGGGGGGEGWLSEQDAAGGGGRVHYTLMNKVDDEEEVAKAFEELKGFWKGDGGRAEGLALWRYDRGFWRWEQKFLFRGE